MKTIHNVPPCAAGVPGGENKPHQLCAKSPGIERSPPWCWPLLSAFALVESGVCVLRPGKRAWFCFFTPASVQMALGLHKC